jgi:hypothetical protein
VNTCKCDLCLGKNAHYSSYYHREEGADLQNRYTIRNLHDRIAKLEKGVDKCACAYCNELRGESMKDKTTDSNPERKETATYKQAVMDARYIFNTYKDKCPAEAWETLHKILFNKSLK